MNTDIEKQPKQGLTGVEVCLNSENSITMHCGECDAEFAPRSKRQNFCGNACRQAAHRKSPAHRQYLDNQKKRRLLRRNERCRQVNRDKVIGALGNHGGPNATGILPLGAMTLPELDGRVVPPRQKKKKAVLEVQLGGDLRRGEKQ